MIRAFQNLSVVTQTRYIILENLWVLSLFTKWLILVRVNLRLFLRIITQHMTKLQSHSLLIRKKLSLSVRVRIRIGQGIEFDYCSVHSVLSLEKAGIETIIINNNPETVSTDFDTSDKLYFEPLTEEDVYNIIELEKPDGVILQFGGQTAIKLANFLDSMHVPVLGTQPKYIDEAEDREKFDEMLEKLNIKRPKGKAVWSVKEGIEEANKLEYPLLVRPSYVLGGQGMEITRNEIDLVRYLTDAFIKDTKNPVLIDRYLDGRELEVDAICDGTDVLIPGIMEHLERACTQR